MARKNSVTKRKKYNEYLVEEEKKRQQERKEKMEQMKKLREKKKEIMEKLEAEGEVEMADPVKTKTKKIPKYERKRLRRLEKQREMNQD
mmetsp:Transcript_12706/g.15838  ORF Transcript_12706/g.15838 Transcript_12706/m.15838 type:complete len:89 (+) Transcript_12706:63-329(+)|eukprot:CAMPEP_0206197514 /NCGR_PEP_ID=MMETSP0166-20121206/9098_1 /ASSEMBLY_ACC=CAM_ASM_000260 /TAXON_ID=95228 /ORGANISM="Vannella robusta, Strain DIVA3 518/3/11/1/6" /LENGTH=88 /DNA_ID=CAMNT_0053615213 /DNA_START=57 /DNA_END=323 /DNA_ORIENTATION=+